MFQEDCIYLYIYLYICFHILLSLETKTKQAEQSKTTKKKTFKMQDQMWKWSLENVLHSYSVWQIYTL